MIQDAQVGVTAAQQARRAQLVAARLCGVAPEILGAPRDAGGAGAVLARHLAMYFANRVYRFSHARTAAMFGRARDASSYACRRIESLREDPKVDWQLFEAETLLRAAELMAKDAGDAS